MAHIDKFKAPQVQGVLQHNERTGDTPTHNHSNEDIDPTKTKDNYELHSVQGSAMSRYNKRMSEVKCMQRDDVTVLDGFVVHLPEDVKPEDERKFFEAVYDFACKEFGKKNIINATVHRDETRDHIHCSFIPVVEATVKRGEHKGEKFEKVSHSEAVPREKYQTLHTRLSEFVTERLGYEVSILNGSTVGGNKTVQELKAQRAKERAEEQEKKAVTAEKKAAELQGQVRELSQRVNDLTEQAEQAEKRAVDAESSLVNLLDGVPPCPQEPKEPTKSMSFTAEQARQNDREYRKDMKEYKKAAKAYPKARKEWESKYLTPDNISKAKDMVESQRSQIQPTLARARAAEQAAASDRAKAKAEKEQAEKERQAHAESVRNEALRLVQEREAELFGRDGKSRTERLESFCEGVKYEDGSSVLDAFEQQEDERRQEYRQTSFRGR